MPWQQGAALARPNVLALWVPTLGPIPAVELATELVLFDLFQPV